MEKGDWIVWLGLLTTLEHLSCAGFNDDPAADLVRDWLDVYWTKMTDAERTRARELSVVVAEVAENDA